MQRVEERGKRGEKRKRKTKYKKRRIPKALREQVWTQYFGKCFEHSCYIDWCKNKITVFNYHIGHDIPESKGGTLAINNLKPICSRCNLSMSDDYTIKEWIDMGKRKGSCWGCCTIC